MNPTPHSPDIELLRALTGRIDQQDPGAFNNLGVLYHSKGLHAEAVDALLQALALNPRMQIAARNLEVAAAASGACNARLAALEARVGENPGDRTARREQAQLLRLIGRHAESEALLDALLADDPDDAPTLLERGLLEQRTGDLRRAQRWFERASNADTEEPIARLHLAEVLYHRGQNEQSLEALDALLALEPGLADAHLLRGFVLGDMGHHEAGMDAARRASELNPSLSTPEPNLSLEPDVREAGAPMDAQPAPPASSVMSVVKDGALARYGLGLAFRQRGYFRESRIEFERALAQGEDERLVRHAIAEVDIVAGNFVVAQATYLALIATYGEHARWWNEHGVATHQSGSVATAAESYRRALRCDPRYALAYSNLGVALADLGESAAAREALQRAASIDPTLVRARLNLARWHARHRDPLAALALLRELVAFHERDADAWHDMGLVLIALHRPEEARRAFATAIEHRPGHAEARYALAQVLGALGDSDGALRETQHALGLAPMRMESRLTVGIDLQLECPEAAGSLDLLALNASDPLSGATINEAALVALLPEPMPDVFGGVSSHPVAPSDSDESSCPEAELLCNDADAFAARGLHGEALERYASAARDVEWSGPMLLWRRAALGQARSSCLLGRGAESLDLLHKVARDATDTGAEDAEVLALLANAYACAWKEGDGEPREARATIARFLRLEPRSGALLHFVGDVAIQLREEALAIVLFRRALALDPSRPSPRVAIARVLRRRKDYLAAHLELVAALAFAPVFRDALLELARLHGAAGRAAEALPILVAHLEREPTDVEALTLLGATLIRLGRESDARPALVRARRHDPDYPHALWLEGTLLAKQGRMREAHDRWSHLLSVAPADRYAARAREALAHSGNRAPQESSHRASEASA